MHCIAMMQYNQQSTYTLTVGNSASPFYAKLPEANSYSMLNYMLTNYMSVPSKLKFAFRVGKHPVLLQAHACMHQVFLLL